MINVMNQRWRARRARFRPPEEAIQTRLYEVAAIPDDTTAKAFVTAHHYSATYPAARFRFGLYRGPRLEGVAVFSHPVNNKTITNNLPCPLLEGVDLGRFVLLDAVAGNGETWFLARCFELLRREGIAGVVSMSDPVPRTTVDGTVVFAGHIGTIYQAHNAVYKGRSTPKTQRLLPDGTEFSPRAAQKIRAREQGWVYSAQKLVRFGADEPWDDARGWLRHWVPKLTRRRHHPGNFTYVWGLNRAIRKALPEPLPYPKLKLGAVA